MNDARSKNDKKFLFVGPRGVGKTFLAKYCSKILSNDGKKVALIDATRNRGLYYSICVGEDEKKTNALLDLAKGKNTAVPYGNVDIFTNDPAERDIPYDSVFKNLDLIQEEYDTILIDADFKAALEISPSAKILLVQDFRRESAIFSQQSFLLPLALKVGEGGMPDAAILYNKAMPCKLKLEQIEHYLMFVLHKGRGIKLLMNVNPEDVKIPFNQENYLIDLNNVADGIIETKRLTTDLKKSLFTVCNLIAEMKNSLKKTV